MFLRYQISSRSVKLLALYIDDRTESDSSFFSFRYVKKIFLDFQIGS